MYLSIWFHVYWIDICSHTIANTFVYRKYIFVRKQQHLCISFRVKSVMICSYIRSHISVVLFMCVPPSLNTDVQILMECFNILVSDYPYPILEKNICEVCHCSDLLDFSITRKIKPQKPTGKQNPLWRFSLAFYFILTGQEWVKALK